MVTTTTLKVGDLVKHKSGGPRMTVHTVEANAFGKAFIHCGWFAGKKLETASFPPEALVLDDAKDAKVDEVDE